MNEPTARKTSWRPIGWWVCLAGAGVGGFFGAFWGLVGIACGAVGGVVAGGLWSAWMRRQLADARPVLVWQAVGMGAVVGLLATVILHAALLATEAVWHWRPRNTDIFIDPGSQDYWTLVPMIGIPCGIVAGAFLGLVCGCICWSAWGRRKPADGSPVERTRA